ncbi:hypothetical protein [Vibrio genomosp. F10]|uniref:hypothetical protein n=1 Tax=Vibrio genomosp. F10 TaxID=723171 RepID=UPI00036030F9|nr:hypothetical protein [Vibrio genomosp. F10]OEF18976.1 hypothetical protein A1QK_21365 [Vibrio genomosp. F10 str. 9ZD137]
MDKISISDEVVTDFIHNSKKYTSATPEGAILRQGYSQGVRLRHIKAGWVEFNTISQTWTVFKVCSSW